MTQTLINMRHYGSDKRVYRVTLGVDRQTMPSHVDVSATWRNPDHYESIMALYENSMVLYGSE